MADMIGWRLLWARVRDASRRTAEVAPASAVLSGAPLVPGEELSIDQRPDLFSDRPR